MLRAVTALGLHGALRTSTFGTRCLDNLDASGIRYLANLDTSGIRYLANLDTSGTRCLAGPALLPYSTAS